MMSNAYTLGKTCVACGNTRAKKNIAYDPETFLAYCADAYICPEGDTRHIHSAENIIKHGKKIKLLSLDEAQDLYTEHLKGTMIDSETVSRIRKMVEHPTSVRLVSPEMAAFLIHLQKDRELNSISDAIKFCIEQMMDINQDYTKTRIEGKIEQDEKKEIEKDRQAIEKEINEGPAGLEEDTEELIF